VIGEVVRDLGGGRQTKEAKIQPDVGLDQMLKPGEAIDRPLCRIHARTEADADMAAERLAGAFDITDEKTGPFDLICEILG
jgi:thymidine phosphorylase